MAEGNTEQARYGSEHLVQPGGGGLALLPTVPCRPLFSDTQWLPQLPGQGALQGSALCITFLPVFLEQAQEMGSTIPLQQIENRRLARLTAFQR